ncbi:hypothetical protein B2J93_6573 [Marssonina coronariae]|uniref:Uncharacterized protein n=1 Tax=Diplocarpon coronariae TaxID=2795749 RepID=A0A218Z0R0_9HELO|nr:hypothetical protein B2J93_6573 [Marssonina coronariae]
MAPHPTPDSPLSRDVRVPRGPATPRPPGRDQQPGRASRLDAASRDPGVPMTIGHVVLFVVSALDRPRSVRESRWTHHPPCPWVPLVVAGPSQGPEARELELELERDETGLCTTRVGRGAGREGRRQGTVGYETRSESADPRMFGALSCRYRCLSRWSGLVTAQGRLGVGVGVGVSVGVRVGARVGVRVGVSVGARVPRDYARRGAALLIRRGRGSAVQRIFGFSIFPCPSSIFHLPTAIRHPPSAIRPPVSVSVRPHFGVMPRE